jgi:hypothetical protein
MKFLQLDGEERNERLGTRESNHSFYTVIGARESVEQSFGRGFHRLGGRRGGVPRIGEAQAFGCATQQLTAHRLFERRQAPADGGMVDRERTCRTCQRSRTFQGQNVFQVVPIHGWALLHIALAISRIVSNPLPL